MVQQLVTLTRNGKGREQEGRIKGSNVASTLGLLDIGESRAVRERERLGCVVGKNMGGGGRKEKGKF